MFVVPHNTPCDYLEERGSCLLCSLFGCYYTATLSTIELLNIDTIYRMCTNYIQFSLPCCVFLRLTLGLKGVVVWKIFATLTFSMHTQFASRTHAHYMKPNMNSKKSDCIYRTSVAKYNKIITRVCKQPKKKSNLPFL